MNVDQTLILIVIVLVLVAWFVLFLFTLHRETETAIPTYCPKGMCATDLLTGVKTCPEIVDTQVETRIGDVCNPPSLCTSSRTLYAKHADGSALTAQCEAGVSCPCVRISTCPMYVQALIALAGNGSITAVQATIQKTNLNTPLVRENGSDDMCTVPMEWLFRSNPGCYTANSTPTATDVTTCLNSLPRSTVCTGINKVSTPCLQGTPAYILSDEDAEVDLLQDSVACVAGVPCACGQIPVWSQSLGKIVCRGA